MKQRGDQTEIMLLRPCVIKPAFNYIDIWLGWALMPQRSTESYRTSASYTAITKNAMSQKNTNKVRPAILCWNSYTTFHHSYYKFDCITIQTHEYFNFNRRLLSLVGEKTPLKPHLDHRYEPRLSTESVDSIFLCTAGGRNNLRTDRELRPSLREIRKKKKKIKKDG